MSLYLYLSYVSSHRLLHNPAYAGTSSTALAVHEHIKPAFAQVAADRGAGVGQADRIGAADAVAAPAGPGDDRHLARQPILLKRERHGALPLSTGLQPDP